MIDFLSYALVIAGALTLAVGYRKSNRNLMLLGAILLASGGGINEFVEGVIDGYKS